MLSWLYLAMDRLTSPKKATSGIQCSFLHVAASGRAPILVGLP